MTNFSRIEMSRPGLWLAALRIAVGLYFVKALWTKMGLAFLGGVLPYPIVEARWVATMPKIVARQMAENPIDWYRSFVENVVLRHVETFAVLTAWGEVLVGLSLVLGLFVGLGALGGFFLSLNYGLASQHMAPASFGFHMLLVEVMLVFFLARAGREWGLDGWMAWRWPNRWFTRRPWS